MFPMMFTNPERSSSLLKVTLCFIWSPVASSRIGKLANKTKVKGALC